MQVQTEKAITAIEEEKNAAYQDRLRLAGEKRKQLEKETEERVAKEKAAMERERK
jgi:hypothetical protein